MYRGPTGISTNVHLLSLPDALPIGVRRFRGSWIRCRGLSWGRAGAGAWRPGWTREVAARGCAAPMAPAIIRGSPEGFRRLARPSRGSTPPRGASKPTEIPMPSVKVRENEPFEFALRRFKRTCEKAGVLAETRKREYYEKPTQERKRKAAAAVKRQARRTSRDVTKRQRLY